MESLQIEKILSDDSLTKRDSLHSWEFQERLAQIVRYFIENDFPQLVQLLYRIDVSEEKLKQLLQDSSGVDTADVIAKLIIERQLKKLDLKEKFNDKTDIPEQDKW